jgi:osmoprotectant transport system permease protein
VNLFGEVVSWFGDPAQWHGTFGIPNRLREHVLLSAAALAAAFVLAFPVAVWLGHRRRGGFLAVNVANLGRAVPSLAILLLMVQWLGLEEWPVVGSVTAWITLLALALAPILTNTYVGMRDVPEPVRESAMAMGMSGWQRSVGVELALAIPLVLTGVRIASLQVIATATLAAQVGSGGLGRFIVDGLAVRDYAQVVAGALLVAGLALLVDAAFALGTRHLLRHRPR